MEEIERTFASGDYRPLQYFLLDQAILLNKTGIDFIKLSTTGGGGNDALHIALSILRESQKTIAVINQMKIENNTP